MGRGPRLLPGIALVQLFGSLCSGGVPGILSNKADLKPLAHIIVKWVAFDGWVTVGDEVVRPVEALGFELFGQRALIKGDWKILARQGAHGDGRWELYNLASDPTDSHDLAAQMPEHLASMVQEFELYVAENGVIVQPPDDQGPGVLNRSSYLLFY